MLLEVHDVQVFYGRIQAIKGLSFTVDEGEIVTLIGANGAGKTTTLKTISGVRPVAAGSVLLRRRGHHPHAAAQAGRARHLPGARGPGHLPGHDRAREPGDGLLHPPGPQARQTKQADLERVFTLFPRLAERRTQMGGTLSGGEQQMLAIGRALMARPRLLLLDEPSMGLAPMLIAQIFTIITEINEQGTTILLVEQNAAQALARADRAYVLETGRIVKEGGGRRACSTTRPCRRPTSAATSAPA